MVGDSKVCFLLRIHERIKPMRESRRDSNRFSHQKLQAPNRNVSWVKTKEILLSSTCLQILCVAVSIWVQHLFTYMTTVDLYSLTFNIGVQLYLVDYFNPFEKYARQIGSFPQIEVKIKNIWNHHPDTCWWLINMVVSKNMGTHKSSILIGFSIINHPFWGTPNFWKHPYTVPAWISMMCRFLVCDSNTYLYIAEWSLLPCSVFRVNKCYGKNLKIKRLLEGPSIFKSKGMGDLFHSVHKEK